MLVTPNSSMSWLWAGEIIELPMELKPDQSLDHGGASLVSHARNALDDIMATCHAFFPEDQL